MEEVKIYVPISVLKDWYCMVRDIELMEVQYSPIQLEMANEAIYNMQKQASDIQDSMCEYIPDE